MSLDVQTKSFSKVNNQIAGYMMENLQEILKNSIKDKNFSRSTGSSYHKQCIYTFIASNDKKSIIVCKKSIQDGHENNSRYQVLVNEIQDAIDQETVTIESNTLAA